MKRFYFILAMIIALTLSANALPKDFKFPKSDVAAKKKLADRAQVTSDFSKSGNLNYVDGMLWIKLKKGVKATSSLADKSVPGSRFGVQSLDNKLSELGVTKIVQNFAGNKLTKTLLAKRPNLAENDKIPDLTRIYTLTLPKGITPAYAAAILKSDPNVEYVSPVAKRQFTAIPNDELYQQMAHLPQVKAPEAWDIHKGEDGEVPVLVGINDSGVEWNHPDLLQNLFQNLAEDANGNGMTIVFDLNDEKWILDPGDLDGVDDDDNGFVDDLIGWNFVSEMDNTPVNDPMGSPINAHGTHVSGIAAGVTNNEIGIASISWNVKYLATKHSPNDDGRSIWNAYEGLVYLANMGCDVINCSWGGSGWNMVEQEVITYCNSVGSVIIASAGNGNTDEVQFPSGYTGVVNIASVDVNDYKASYSTYGISVDMAAPGGNRASDNSVLSTVPYGEYAIFNGTSMSTPLVTGAFALLKSYHPDWSNYELKKQLLTTTDDIYIKNPNFEGMLGSGRLNAFRMLTEQNPEPENRINLAVVHHETDDDNDELLMAGETSQITVYVRNYNDIVGTENAEFVLTTENPYITIIDGSITADIVNDGNALVTFTVEVSDDAMPCVFDFNLNITTTDGVVLNTGNDYTFKSFIYGDAVLVYDLFLDFNGGQYGNFISKFYTENGLNVVLTNELPATLSPFSAVFILGGDIKNYGLWNDELLTMLVDYIMVGGKIYIESPNLYELLSAVNSPTVNFLLGVGGGALAEDDLRILTTLNGNPLTITNGMTFEGTEQFYAAADKISGNNMTGFTAFTEEGYGNVAVQGMGIFGQRTFLSTYTLPALIDEGQVSNRYEFFYRLANFFGLDMPDYAAADFANFPEATLQAPATILFGDNSAASGNILSWEWDFNEDGIPDSYDQDPEWEYTSPGHYDVTLTISTSYGDYSITKYNAVKVFNGESSVRMAEYYPSIVVGIPSAETAVTNRITFEAWINPNENLRFSPEPQLLDNGPIWIWLTQSGRIVLTAEHENETYTYIATVPQVFNFGEWSHVAITLDAVNQEAKFYINGEMVEADLNDYGYGDGDFKYYEEYPILIGALSNLDYPFEGRMDEVRLWNIIRSQEDIQYAMQDKHLTNINGLGAYWRFNDPGTILSMDQSGNNVYAILLKSDWFWGYRPQFTINVGNQEICAGTTPKLGSHYHDKNDVRVCNTAVGGSGDYTYTWYPNAGLNFTIHPGDPLDPTFNTVKNYYLSVLDNVTGEELSKNITVRARTPVSFTVPLIRTCRTGNSISLAEGVNITNGVSPYTYAWTDKLGWTSTDANPTVTPARSTRYYLTITDANGCISAEKRIYVIVGNFPKGIIVVNEEDIVTGLNGDILMTVYPNPAIDEVTIFADFSIKGDAKISVVDMLGKTVQSFTRYNADMITEQIRLNNLPTGTYLISINFNGETYTRKFIKQ